MEQISIQDKEKNKNGDLNTKNKKIIIVNDFSTKKFETIIHQNHNIYQNINLLLPKNHKVILNPSYSLKKENSKKYYENIYSLSNSNLNNILMKSTEENLISDINRIENLFSKNSLPKIKKVETKRESLKKKKDESFIKNAIKLFHKLLIKEKDKIEKDEKIKSKNKSTETLNYKILKDIRNEKNKILSKQGNESDKHISGFNKIRNTKTIKSSQSKVKRKSLNSNEYSNSNKDKSLKKKNQNKKENLKIKTLEDINSDISKIIRKSSMRDMKKKLRKLQSLDITEMIGKYSKKRESLDLRRKSLELTMFNFDVNKLRDLINEDEYQKKYRNLFLCNNLYDSLDDDEIEDQEIENNFHIGPNDLSCYIIDSLTLAASLISLINIPFFIAFILGNCKFNICSEIYIFFIIIEIIYLIDLFSGFFRAYYNFEEVLIVKKKYMCLNYLKSSFIFDLIESIPFFMIFNFSQENCNNNNFNNFTYNNNLKYSFLFLKILKIFKTFKNSAIKIIDKFLSENNFYSDWKNLFANIFIIICVLHIATCYLIFLEKNIYPGWIAEKIQTKSYIDIYIASLYYIITTLTTVGYGDITLSNDHERFFQIILLIGGTLSYSWLLTYMSDYVKKNQEKYIVYENKMKILEEIKTNYPNLDNNLYERIHRYLKYNKSRYKFDIKYVLESLPASIQNNLIIEIYKPIIKNFLFFKYFENSDFFVKIVTSMKPILSMKDDLLVQEGDIIEEIIFIKSGILSLEIGIDLNEPKKDAEKYLNISQNKSIKQETFRFPSITSQKGFDSHNLFLTTDSRNIIKQEKFHNKKSIKIINLRRNEHFGDISMILNEKSPVTIKVRSKKAELLFLQKTDATEISNLYPNIWKRIVNKSLYNLNQIKKIIKRKIILYCEMNDIELNEELTKKYMKKKFIKKRKNNKKKYIRSIIKEVDESNYLSGKNSITPQKPFIRNNSIFKNNLNDLNKSNRSFRLSENENENDVPLTKRKDKEKNLNINNNIIFSCQINNNNNNNNNMNFGQKDNIKEISNKNSDINIDSLIKYLKENNYERINEENFFTEDLDSDIIKKRISMNNYDKNNLIYQKGIETEEKEEKLIFQKNTDDKIDKLLKDNNNEKELIDNNSENICKNNKQTNNSNNIIIDDSYKDDNKLKDNSNKTNKFCCLLSSLVESFKINSTYENINKISKYEYASSSIFRQKVKNFILQLSFNKNKTFQSPNNTKSVSFKGPFLKNKIYPFSAEKKKIESEIDSPKEKENEFAKENLNKFNTFYINHSPVNKKENNKYISSIVEGERTFYMKYKDIDIKPKKRASVKFKDKFKKLNNYEEQISKNIENNQQKLNNPEEYYSGFFSKILTKNQS